jgi:hypothetical protein
MSTTAAVDHPGVATEGQDDSSTFLVTVELAGGGQPRRRVATICRARNRAQAEQIAADVNEDVPHVYILSVQIADLQVVYPLVCDRGVLKNDWSGDAGEASPSAAF